MRIYPPQIEIGENEGFDKEKDIFKYADFGTSLMTLNERVKDPLVIALDGPWGSGKTTFIQMWLGLLRNNGFPVIYFDAFANDHIDDAFTAIAGNVIALAKELPGEGDKNLKDKALEVVKVLSKNAVKKGSAGIVDIDEMKKSITKVTDSLLRSQLENYAKDQKAFEEFRISLEEVATELGKQAWDKRTTKEEASEDQEEEPPNRPLIFVIDELDRCKPPFALELLEKIKHFFSVEGVNFVLVTNLRQLENSVKCSYGIEGDEDARVYLEKFYNLVASLPNNERKGTTVEVNKFLSHVFKDFPDDGENNNFSAQIIEQLSTIAKVKNLSLRSMEKIATRVAMVLATTTTNDPRYISIIPGLCAIKVCAPSLFEKAKNSSLIIKEVTDFFEFDKWVEKTGFVHTNATEEQWRTLLDPNGENGSPRHGLSNIEVIPRQCELIDQIKFSQ